MHFRLGDIEGVEIRRLLQSTDERGWLTEIYRSDEMSPEVMPAMGYVSVTRPGMSRGPHEHRMQTDMFCFVGPGIFELHLWDNRPECATYGNYQTMTVSEGDPAVLIIPPGVVHAYKNIGDEDAMVINLPNRLYKGEGRREQVDEIRHEEVPEGPFHLE